jgi:hypothetical protein
MSKRKNPKHGGGPRTDEGKARSSMNSLRHGLTGKTVILPTEDPDQFEELIADYIRDFKPGTAVETDLVHELVVCRWRLQRLWNIESCLFEITMIRKSQEVDSQIDKCPNSLRTALAFMTMADDSKAVSLLLRYETRLTRRYDQVLKEIKALQNQRTAEAKEAASKNCQTNSPKPARPASVIQLLPPKPSPRSEETDEPTPDADQPPIDPVDLPVT